MHTTRLKKNFDKKDFQTGASLFKQASWYLTSLLLFRSGVIPFSSLLVFILRSFGARIGKDVRIKPYIYIRYPWKLTIGDHSWLADCYIENLDQVYIGNHVCISQRAMVLTGSHNYKKPAFDLITKPVTIQTGAWICANTTVVPGVWVGAGSVLIAGSVATSDLAPNTIYQGNPARIKRKRY